MANILNFCVQKLRYQRTPYGFSIFHDGILCKDCAKVSKDVMEINGSTLYALQYIVYSDIKNLFTFVVSDEVLTEMKMVMARCMHAYVDKK